MSPVRHYSLWAGLCPEKLVKPFHSRPLIPLFIQLTIEHCTGGLVHIHVNPSLRTTDAFPVVASLPPKNREATTENASAVRRLRQSMYEEKFSLINIIS